MKLKNFLRIRSKLNNKELVSPKEGYKIWAEIYDDEENNLMLQYDEIILDKLIEPLNLKGKTILDFGCGTGRNWNKFYQNKPSKLIGCDVSYEMLNKLRSKFPEAEIHLMQNDDLSFLQDKSCDIIVSTLVIAHLRKLTDIFTEWNRVLKDKAEIIITDFHPDLLAKGGTRSFSFKGRIVKIENFNHTIDIIKILLYRFGFRQRAFIEKNIDEDVKHFYESKNAINVYNKFKTLPFVYGLHLTR